MGKFAKIAIVFIVAVIVIATGFLYETGRLSLLSTGKNSTQYPTTSPQYNSPNVVSSNQVNKSVGGSWTQTTGTVGVASNASSLVDEKIILFPFVLTSVTSKSPQTRSMFSFPINTSFFLDLKSP